MTEPDITMVKLVEELTSLVERVNRLDGLDKSERKTADTVKAPSLQQRVVEIEKRLGKDFSLPELRTQVDKVEHGLDEAKNRTDDLAAALDSTKSMLGDVSKRLDFAIERARGLVDRVIFLEAHVRRLDRGRTTADLNNWPQECQQWAEIIRAYEQVQGLLPHDDQDDQLRDPIKEYKDKRSEQELFERQALQHARELAHVWVDEIKGYRDHQEAKVKWQHATGKAKKIAFEVETLKGEHDHARKRLDDYQRERDKAKPVEVNAKQAKVKLRELLYDRLAQELDAGKLLPNWFLMLGSVAPTDNHASWMNIAVDVLSYRVLYNVTDQEWILGPNPRGESLARKRRYDDLTAKIKQFEL